MHPNAWRKIVCAHFPWNTLYFSQNSHFIFFHFLQIPFSLIQYPLWELFKVRISTTGHECKQQTKLNNSMYLCQNIIRADSENLFQWRGKGLQTLISRTQKLFAANYFLTTPPNLPPPPPCFTCSYTNISLSTKSADECRTDMWSCHGWWEPSVCHRVTPSPLNNCDHNSAYCCQVSRPNKEGGRVWLKTGLKLRENILQTVRRIDFQIIEVKGIAVIFIYSKSSSLHFQLLVEVVIKKAMGIFAWQAPISFFLVYVFFMIP